MAVVDFDNTLISEDSFSYILKKERWYLDPGVLCCGIRLAFCLALQDRKSHGGRKVSAQAEDLAARSRFKEKLLQKYAKLPENARNGYAEHFRTVLHRPLIARLQSAEYDCIVVASASEKHLIEATLQGVLHVDRIIANDESLMRNAEGGAVFRTCWGPEKARRFVEEVPDYREYETDVYSDSMSDKPLFDLSDHAFMVREHGQIEKIS